MTVYEDDSFFRGLLVGIAIFSLSMIIMSVVNPSTNNYDLTQFKNNQSCTEKGMVFAQGMTMSSRSYACTDINGELREFVVSG